MTTYIKTAHEEDYSDGSKTLGVLFNFSDDDENFSESFVYIYREKNYIFFNTMIDMFDYLLYSDKKMKRAYMSEEDFDKYYYPNIINSKFSELLNWR